MSLTHENDMFIISKFFFFLLYTKAGVGGFEPNIFSVRELDYTTELQDSYISKLSSKTYMWREIVIDGFDTYYILATSRYRIIDIRKKFFEDLKKVMMCFGWIEKRVRIFESMKFYGNCTTTFLHHDVDDYFRRPDLT